MALAGGDPAPDFTLSGADVRDDAASHARSIVKHHPSMPSLVDPGLAGTIALYRRGTTALVAERDRAIGGEDRAVVAQIVA